MRRGPGHVGSGYGGAMSDRAEQGIRYVWAWVLVLVGMGCGSGCGSVPLRGQDVRAMMEHDQDAQADSAVTEVTQVTMTLEHADVPGAP